jgi:adenosylmethionine-8-amino-7-oxononanoate aminotransferase
VTPDFLCLAKGITGGYLPLAATLSTEEVYDAFLGPRSEMKHFFHGHTYTANPLACAVGIESLALLRDSTLGHAQALEPELAAAVERIGRMAGVREVRRCGWMVGIELERGAAATCARVRNHGVILRQLGEVVVWMPPLVLAKSELELLEQATAAAIREVHG